MSDKFSFCPICQLPLQAINISPDAHVSECLSRNEDGEIEECPQGVHCLNDNRFHYRDFSHKLLADYRSSSDFVPPNIEFKPSPKKRKTPPKQPKRSSPRKKKTPDKKDVKNNSASDDESDSEVLLQTKRPRRNLKFNEKPNKAPSQSKEYSSKTTASKKGLNYASSKSHSELHLEDDSKTAKENGGSDVPNNHQENDVSNTPIQKSAIVNVKLNSGDELRLTKSRLIASISSTSVTTAGTSIVGTDTDSEATSECSNRSVVNPSTKVVLRKPVLTLTNSKPNCENMESQSVESSSKADSANMVLKKPILTLERLKTHDRMISKSQSNIVSGGRDLATDKSKANATQSDPNGLFNDTDFDDIIPGSMLDKDLLKTIEKKLDSPANTLHSCSGFNETGSSISLVVGVRTNEEDNDSVGYQDRPSSPEVTIPSPRKKSLNLLSSSSDSDIPLSKLISKKPDSAVNKITKTKGKVKAGKFLRCTNKTSTHFNGFSLLNNNSIDTEVNVISDKESESGKSSAHTDISFVPSEKTSSSLHSDSALSAQSTDQLTSSSASSTYTSSSETYSETRSSDPSYSEESDATSKSRHRKSSPKHGKIVTLSPKKKRLVKPLLSLSEESTTASSSTSSSEISLREKLLFGDKKLSPKKKISKQMKSPVKPKKPFKSSTLRLLDTTDSDDKSEWQSLLNKMRNGCFPSDLKIDSEDSLTVVSSCSGSDTSHASNMLPLRQCPFYKRIPDTPFAVDAFQYWNIPGVKIYFLSHFHSDHYIGLKKSFAHPIYCTRITANLVRMKLRVEEKWLRVIDLNQPQIISGVEVTALDANHCPGSVMFLFALTNGQSYLHVGDFRASRGMTFYPPLRNVAISKLFLDTTYCSPQYCFPTQEEVISRVVDIIKNHVKDHPRTLVVCGSYTIGKEKVFLGVAEALDWRIWARPEKQRVFGCLSDARIDSRLVKDCCSANVHVLPMASLQIRALQQHLESCRGAFTHVIGVKPTGWELNAKSDQFKITSRDNIQIYGVPYSEHSSFTELRDFVQFIQPREIVPTVNVGSEASRKKMNKHFADWMRPQTGTEGKSEKQTKVSQYFKTNS